MTIARLFISIWESKNMGLELNQWLIVLLTFCASLAFLLLTRKLLWKKFAQWAQTSSSSLDDLLLAELKLPFLGLLFVLSAGIALQVAPESIRAQAWVHYGSKISLIAIGIWIFERVLSAIFQSQALPIVLAGSTKILVLTLFRLALLSFGFLIILDTVGISITPILASLGVGSVAVALALQDTLGNFFSGLYLLIDKPIRIGDFIKIDEGIEGHVTKIGWRSTHIQMLANNVIVLPNSKIAASQLTNYNLPDPETAVLIQVGVSYSSDLTQVERVTCEVSKEVLGRVAGGISTFDPFIRYHTFGDSSINFTVILRAQKITDQYLLKHEFTKALHARYLKEKISIPFPQRVVHMSSHE
jgi:small-conductance mechanosensitive channel